MQPDAARFIRLATQPLADNKELRLAAEAELEKLISTHAADPPVGTLTAAADALERADQYPNRRRWRWVLYGVTLLISLSGMAHIFSQFFELKTVISSIFGGSPMKEKPLPGLTPSENLLLLGRDHAATHAEQWKPLWESQPQNPAYFAEYAAGYFRDHKHLSPEILATAEKIDPENGWYLGFEAATAAEVAVKRDYTSRVKSTSDKAAVFTVLDEKALAEALAIVHRIAAKPRFTSHQMELWKQRIPLFQPRRDIVRQIPVWIYYAKLTYPNFCPQTISYILAAGAERCTKNGDINGFHQITRDWHTLAISTTQGDSSTTDLMIAKRLVTSPAANFRDSAHTLGLKEESRYFGALIRRAAVQNRTRVKRQNSNTMSNHLLKTKSAILGDALQPWPKCQVLSPPPITDADLRPGRYGEHAFLNRLLTVIGCFVLSMVAAFTASARYLTSPLVTRLARRLSNLMRLRDFYLLFLTAVIFPLSWYLVITHFTPCSAREWSAGYLNGIPAVGQFGCFIMSLVTLPFVLASRLLANRANALGLKLRHPWLGVTAAVAALGGVPAFGAVSLYAGFQYGWLVPCIFPAVAMVAPLISERKFNMFSEESRRLRSAVLNQLTQPVLVFGMLMLALLAAFFYAEERHWVPLDHMAEISTEFPAASRYDYEITQILRHEILELLGTPPEIR